MWSINQKTGLKKWFFWKTLQGAMTFKAIVTWETLDWPCARTLCLQMVKGKLIEVHLHPAINEQLLILSIYYKREIQKELTMQLSIFSDHNIALKRFQEIRLKIWYGNHFSLTFLSGWLRSCRLIPDSAGMGRTVKREGWKECEEKSKVRNGRVHLRKFSIF